MANDWSALFDKVLSDKDLRDQRISISWRQDYMYFASSNPVAIFDHPWPLSFKLEIDTCVIFKWARHDNLLLVYSWKPEKAKFVFSLFRYVDFNPHHKIDAYYKWVDNLLEIKLQSTLSP